MPFATIWVYLSRYFNSFQFPEGTLRRIVLSTVLSAPILILITQGIMMAMFGSSSRAVRVVGVLGGLLGSVTNSLQLAGMFYERSFPCQVESPSPTSRYHKDRRSYEVKYFVHRSRSNINKLFIYGVFVWINAKSR